MSSTANPTANSPAATPPASRSPVERLVVWGGILILLALVGYEYSVKRNYTQGSEALTQALENIEKDTKINHGVTNVDVTRLLGKQPEFSGNPGQIYPLNSHYYEAYVWRSLLKHKFIAPPKEPELLDDFAIFTGDVAPENVKYRTPDLDKNRSSKPSFFDAYVLYVYYGHVDPKTKAREVIHVVGEREKYFDEALKLPDAAELKRRHDINLAKAVEDTEKGYHKLSQKEIDDIDPWKNPARVKRPGKEVPLNQYVLPRKAAEVQDKKESVTAPEKPTSTPAGSATATEADKPTSGSPEKPVGKEKAAPETTPAKSETAAATKKSDARQPEEKKQTEKSAEKSEKK